MLDEGRVAGLRLAALARLLEPPSTDEADTDETDDEPFDPARLAIDPDVATILSEYPRWAGAG